MDCGAPLLPLETMALSIIGNLFRKDREKPSLDPDDSVSVIAEGVVEQASKRITRRRSEWATRVEHLYNRKFRPALERFFRMWDTRTDETVMDRGPKRENMIETLKHFESGVHRRSERAGVCIASMSGNGKSAIGTYSSLCDFLHFLRKFRPVVYNRRGKSGIGLRPAKVTAAQSDDTPVSDEYALLYTGFDLTLPDIDTEPEVEQTKTFVESVFHRLERRTTVDSGEGGPPLDDEPRALVTDGGEKMTFIPYDLEQIRIISQEPRLRIIITILGHPCELPSMKELAYYNPDIHESTISQHVTVMEEAGVLTRVEIPKGARQKGNPYKFVLLTDGGHDLLQKRDLLLSRRDEIREEFYLTERTEEIHRYERAPRPQVDVDYDHPLADIDGDFVNPIDICGDNYPDRVPAQPRTPRKVTNDGGATTDTEQ